MAKELKIGRKVTDHVDGLGEGVIIDVYLNRCCGDEPATMLTVDFGKDQVFDRLPEEVALAA